MAGCQSFNSSPGTGSVTTKQVDTFRDTKGVEHHVETTHTVLLEQPANAEKPATMEVKTNPDSTIDVSLNTGSSYNLGRVMAGNALLTPVIWAGIGLIFLGAGVGVISKGTLLKPAIGLGVAGASLIAIGYLLSQYAFVLMIGLVIGGLVLIGYALYYSKVFKDQKVAVTETVSLIEGLKQNYMSLEERYKEFKSPGGLANVTQSPETKKVVAQVKEETGLNNV